MKVLHINDVAGVACALVKYLNKAGHQAKLINYMVDSKNFGFIDFYKSTHFQDSRIMQHILEGVVPQFDIIHVHFDRSWLPFLYKFNKPIVMHFHGTEIATQTMDIRLACQKCEMVLVAGEQLLQYHPRAKYLPTIVDTEHFTRRGEPNRNALLFDIPYLDTQKALEVFKQAGGGEITIHDRLNNLVPFKYLPEVLSSYQKFVDVRYHKKRGMLTDRSKTGLEALSCGLQVLTEKGEWVAELPEKHKPELVVNKLLEMYGGIL